MDTDVATHRSGGFAHLRSISRDRRAVIGLGSALAAYLVVAVSSVLVRSPMGHDESVYAIRARDLGSSWQAVSGGYWADYRAPGLPMMLSVTNRLVGAHVVTMRLTVVLLGAMILIGSWFIARYLRLGPAAAVAPFLLAVSAGFTFTTSTVLADAPGAAFGIIAVAVYLVEVDRGRLRWSMAVVPIASAWATVARFGAPIMIGAGLFAAFVVAAPEILRRRNWLVVVQSACLALGTALVIWLVLFTELLSLGDLSPADANSGLIDRKGLTPSSGFADLKLVLNPWSSFSVPIWSKAAAAFFVLGLVAGLVSLARPSRRARAVVFGLMAGAISLAGVTASVGLVVSNYLALSLPFWAVAAAAGYRWMWIEAARVLDASMAMRVVGVVCVSILAVGLVSKATLDTRHLHRQLDVSFAPLRDVSVDTGRQLGDGCLLVTGSAPQVGYYSGCRIVAFRDLATEETLPPILAESVRIATVILDDPPTYDDAAVLIVEQGKRQPANELLLEGVGLGERISEVGSEGQRRQHVWSSPILECVATDSC